MDTEGEYSILAGWVSVDLKRSLALLVLVAFLWPFVAMLIFFLEISNNQMLKNHVYTDQATNVSGALAGFIVGLWRQRTCSCMETLPVPSC